MQLNGVKITDETLNQWIKKVLPEYDLLFFTKESKSLIDHLDSNVLVMSASSFFGDKFFNDFDTLNIYQPWQMTDDVSHVCIVHPDNLIALEDSIRAEIFKAQKAVNGGLIFNWDLIEEQVENNDQLYTVLSPYLFEYNSEKYLAMQYSLWRRLNDELKYGFLLIVAKGFAHEVDLSDEQMKEFKEQYPHIAPYFNTYSQSNGANCFASTLAAISEDNADTEWLITKWVARDSLLYSLKLNDYMPKKITLQELAPKDVLLWTDDDNKVLHSAFYLGNGYYFNKHGQSFPTPWQIVKIDHLIETWGKDNINIYRKI